MCGSGKRVNKGADGVAARIVSYCHLPSAPHTRRGGAVTRGGRGQGRLHRRPQAIGTARLHGQMATHNTQRLQTALHRPLFGTGTHFSVASRAVRQGAEQRTHHQYVKFAPGRVYERL